MTESDNRRFLWRAGAAIAVVGAVSIGAIGIASASGNDTNAGAQPTSSAPKAEDDDNHWGGPWRGGPWMGGFGGGFGGDFGEVLGADVDGILHGEVVLSKEGGGTQTVQVQRGAVTEVSATGVTVKSSDGFTTAYVVNKDTKVRADKDEIGSVAKNEEVLVIAPKSGDKHTATVLLDLTDLGWK